MRKSITLISLTIWDWMSSTWEIKYTPPVKSSQSNFPAEFVIKKIVPRERKSKSIGMRKCSKI